MRAYDVYHQMGLDGNSIGDQFKDWIQCFNDALGRELEIFKEDLSSDGV